MFSRQGVLCLLATMVIAPATSFAGTTTIDFTDTTIGNLVQAGANTLSVNVDCEAEFDGAVTYLVGDGGSAVTSGGTTTITMEITPASDVPIGETVGLILVNPGTGDIVQALVDDSGGVELSSTASFQTDTGQFIAPAAAGSAMTLIYDATTDTATLDIAGGSNDASLTNAFIDNPSVQLGVTASAAGGKFKSVSATGPGVPDFDATGTCGAEGEGEGEGEGEEEPVVVISGGGVIEEGSTLTLAVETDATVLSYQWQKDNVILGGESLEVLTRNNVTAADAGVYRCLVDTASKVAVFSEPTVVTVVPAGSLPLAGGIGLGVVTTIVGLAGAVALRKRR